MKRARKTTLKLFMNNVPVGHLTKLPAGKLELEYDPAWVRSPDSVPLSLSLPLSLEKSSGAAVENFFENLLPESAEARRTLAQHLGLNSVDVFELLSAIGRECVGALQVLPKSAHMTDDGAETTPVSTDQLADLLKGLGLDPLGLGRNESFRLSLPGDYEHTALIRVGKRWHFPNESTSSTHLLRVAPRGFPHAEELDPSIENAWLCLRVCAAYGLPTVAADLTEFRETNVLVTERSDRVARGTRILRYAQEDFCQVFGLPSHKKYEADGGPGIASVMKTLLRSDHPQEDRALFLKSQLVFWLLAATNGHAKNFSIYLLPGGLRLAPLSDVMSAHPAIYEQTLPAQKARLAMAVGDKRRYRLHEIARRHWLQTAKLAGFPEGEMNRLIEEVVELTPKVVAQMTAEIPLGFPPRVAAAILDGLMTSAERLREN